VSALPWESTKLRCWRMDRKLYATSWDSGAGAEVVGGRWNPKGFPVVYCSTDAATAVLEVAVHKGFDALDRVAHVLSCAEITDRTLVHVLAPSQIPNAGWLRSGVPSHAQQQFGRELLQRYPFVAIPSAVLPQSWNLLFTPKLAASQYALREQVDFALDTRLNPPR
jgi:RES domain-containing protein